MESIVEIGKRYGTDKQSKHGYLTIYDELLPPERRENARAILEIGVLKGESLRLWHDAFLDAHI